MILIVCGLRLGSWERCYNIIKLGSFPCYLGGQSSANRVVVYNLLVPRLAIGYPKLLVKGTLYLYDISIYIDDIIILQPDQIKTPERIGNPGLTCSARQADAYFWG